MSSYATAVSNITDKVKQIIGKSDLTRENDEDKRYKAFAPVCDLTYAAKDLYCEGEKSFDESLESLIKALQKLKGKEKELMKDED